MSRLANWLRKWADRIDPAGAPKRTDFGFTIEEGWGVILNDTGQGCPLWYYGDADYAKAHAVRGVHASVDDVQWITYGCPTPDGAVVFGSAEVRGSATTRRMDGHQVIGVPGASRPAKVPNWEITVTAKLASFVTTQAATYQEAVDAMFKRAGIRG